MPSRRVHASKCFTTNFRSRPGNWTASRPTSEARLEELEESFTRTFDLNPVCCLEVGWQLYGEDYNRGSFMVEMRQRIRSHGITETLELPDHLSNLLPLLGRMEPQEAGPLCASFVLSALM